MLQQRGRAATTKKRVEMGKTMLVPKGLKGFVEYPVVMIAAPFVNFPYAPKSFDELPSGRGDDLMHGEHTCFSHHSQFCANIYQNEVKPFLNYGEMWSELHAVGQLLEKSFLIVANGFIDEQPFQEWVLSRCIFNTNVFVSPRA